LRGNKLEKGESHNNGQRANISQGRNEPQQGTVNPTPKKKGFDQPPWHEKKEKPLDLKGGTGETFWFARRKNSSVVKLCRPLSKKKVSGAKREMQIGERERLNLLSRRPQTSITTGGGLTGNGAGKKEQIPGKKRREISKRWPPVRKGSVTATVINRPKLGARTGKKKPDQKAMGIQA